MRKLSKYYKVFMLPFVVSIIIKGLGAVTDIMIPLFMGKMVDEGIATGDRDRIIFMCAMMLIFTVVTVALNLIANYVSANVTQKMGENLRNNLYGHIQKLRVQDVDDMNTASLITRTTNDVERVQSMLLMMCRFIIRMPIMAIGGVVLSLIIDPVLTGVIFVGMCLTGVVSMLVFKFTGPIFRKVQINLDKLALILRENLSGIRVIKSFNKSKYETERFDNQSRKVKENEMAAGKLHTVSGPMIGLISGVTTAAVLFFSMYRLQDGKILVGEIMTIINYINQILMAMFMLPRMFMMLSRATASANRINEVFELTPDDNHGDVEKGEKTPVVLEMQNVSFKYSHGENSAISNINFKIRRGETIGVIGGTGSGKSTLLYLILRLYKPDSGEILLNGRPIDVYSNKYLHKEVTAALQQYNIFAMTVAENVVLNMEAQEDKLREAAEIAQLSDVINGLEEGYSHEIAQTGNNLSGGQKQRVNIARAIYRGASLTILDDVSSALDYQTDLNLRMALQEATKDKSVLLISQRVSSVKSANKILVLDEGRMAGFDTHENLIRDCSVYQELCRTQGIKVGSEGGHAEYATV